MKTGKLSSTIPILTTDNLLDKNIIKLLKYFFQVFKIECLIVNQVALDGQTCQSLGKPSGSIAF